MRCYNECMQYSKKDIEAWERVDAADDDAMTSEQRLTVAFQLFDFYRDTMLGILKARHPEASEQEIDLMFQHALEDESNRAAA